MKLGFFTMPVHRLDRDYTQVLREDREAVILADRLGYSEAYVGEHVTDAAESITNSMLFLASLISDTRQIKLGTGTTNLSHTHPVLVAAQAAMLDHLLKGRFLFGVSPGALESDAEALGIRGIDRNEMFAESIGHIIDIWRGEPPYDLEGKYWKISTRETLHPEIGVGPIPKPYQKPHPPILATVVAPYSKGVIEMGKKGFLPISANFLLDKWVRTHWTNYIRGCEEAGRVANPQDWRVARSIFVHDDHKTALDYGRDNERSPYRYYFNQLFTKLKKANRHAALGARPDFENLRNAVFSLGCLFPLLGYRRSWGWLLGITPILSNSAANCCESLQTSTTSAEDRSGHSTGNAANPTAIARALARRVMARTGC